MNVVCDMHQPGVRDLRLPHNPSSMSGWVNVTGLPDVIDALVLSFARYGDSHSVLLDSTISSGNRYIRGLRCRCGGSVIVESKCLEIYGFQNLTFWLNSLLRRSAYLIAL